MQFKTVIEALEHQRHGTHGITFIESGDSESFVSYKELYDNALALLKHFQDKGLKQGHQLILYLNNNKLFVDAYWACLLGGIVPVPIAVGISDDHKSKLFRVLSVLDHGFIYADQKSFQRLEQYLQSPDSSLSTDISLAQLNQITIIADALGELYGTGVKATVNPNDTAFIQFSSGSTNDPKGVVLTHGNLIANIDGIGTCDKITATDRTLSWMPLTHDMGIIGFHIAMIVYNVNQYLMSTDLFSRRPLLWLTKASEHKATLLCSPNFGYKHYLKSYTEEKAATLDLSHVRLIYNGAEPISVQLCEQFLGTMAKHGLRHTAMHTVYGLAEACLAVSFPDAGSELSYISIDRHCIKVGNRVKFLPREDKDAATFAVEGKPIKNTEVKITDLNNQSLPPDHIGEVLIRGANVTQGYYKNETANSTAYTEDGWLKTGDTGFFHNGELIITGRSKEIIFVNGQNYFPHDLESIALLCPQLELGKVVAYGVSQDIAQESELLIFILHRADLIDFVPVAREVTRLIGEHLGLEVTHVVPVKRIPKTTSGKIQRNLLGQQYLDGEFTEQLQQLAPLLDEPQKPIPPIEKQTKANQVEQQMLDICHTILKDKSVDLHSNLFELGISSLTLTEIHQRLDDLYPNTIELDDLFENPTLSELAKVVRSKLEA